MHLKETERLVDIEEEEKISNNHVVGCDGKASKMSDPLFSALFSEAGEKESNGGFKISKKTSAIQQQYSISDQESMEAARNNLLQQEEREYQARNEVEQEYASPTTRA